MKNYMKRIKFPQHKKTDNITASMWVPFVKNFFSNAYILISAHLQKLLFATA